MPLCVTQLDYPIERPYHQTIRAGVDTNTIRAHLVDLQQREARDL
jgi:hypothetical protein